QTQNHHQRSIRLVHRLRTDLCGRIYLPALGSVPITRRGEQDVCFADGDSGSGLRSHYVRECAKRDRCPDAFARCGLPVGIGPRRNAKPWPCCSSICIAVLLVAACFGYLADSLTPLLLPSYANLVGRIANIPLTLGEPAIILWLLIRGAKDQRLEAAA